MFRAAWMPCLLGLLVRPPAALKRPERPPDQQLLLLAIELVERLAQLVVGPRLLSP